MQKLSLVSVTPVWALVSLGAVLVLVLTPADQQLLWLSVSLAAGIILTFCVQLSLDRKEGFVNRVMASVGGSVVILAIATGVSALITSA